MKPIGPGEGASETGRPAGPPVALTIAGSDSGGGAGIQADLKTFHAFGVYGASAVTAVTAQNTVGVYDVQKVSPDLVRRQIEAVWEDLQPRACKTGMLADETIIRTVVEALDRVEAGALVVDPVMVAASGDRLLEPSAEAALRDLLLPRAWLLTPNLPEAEALTGLPIATPAEMLHAARALLDLGPRAVLMKGGHLPGQEVVDLFVEGSTVREWRSPRIRTRAGHGTGCTLSAAAAAGLARGDPLEVAVDRAIRFTREALARATAIGSGTGPLNHWVSPPNETGAVTPRTEPRCS